MPHLSIPSTVVRSNYPAASGDRSAVSKLPLELLSEVFLILAGTTVKEYGVPVVASDVVAQVCRKWRALALSMSRLWQRFIVTERCIMITVQERLLRSKMRPLEVQILGWPTSTTFAEGLLPVVRAIAGQSRRVKYFVVTGLDLDYTELIMEEFSETAPILRTLYIDADVQEVLQEALPARTLSLFGGQTPQLLRATVIGAPVSLDSFSTLKKLVLQNQIHTSVPKLLSALRRCPELQELNLGFVRRCWDKNTSYPTDPIDLPCLKQLVLDGKQDDVLHTLAHVTFPTTTSVSLWMFYGAVAEREAPHCTSLQTITSRIKHAEIDFVTDLVHASFKLTVTSPADRFVATFDWLMDGEDDGPQGQPSMRFDVLRLSALEHLTVKALPTSRLTHSAEWGRLFDLMPALKKIEFDVPHPHIDAVNLFSPLIIALTPGSSRAKHEAPDAEGIVVRCPQLETMCVAAFWRLSLPGVYLELAFKRLLDGRAALRLRSRVDVLSQVSTET
ncbi:hypothetical protein EVJ58_g2670 [Rhodofomes roseus]|uniref:F-box domain-containing protein n=1 Tax=Rhodofomes roseus TaxID=34475 RepID=A0A4Y9YQF5_9APHY|nr:hypothetical protein EVJ58_g2670 [Rhodofomes roseus]